MLYLACIISFDLPVGTIGVKSEGLMASVDKFEITFKGIGGHAGIPHNAIDPIVIASQYVTNVQSIIARRIDLFHNAVISITSINGGNTWNVIPGSGEAAGYSPNISAGSTSPFRSLCRI